jgi:hypothetical protein
MSEIEKTQAAYAYFTLDEWKQLASAVAASPIPFKEKTALLTKMPSEALGIEVLMADY